MGCFSWMFSDEENEKSLKIGRSAFLACPDGSFIYEPCYEGYGMFNGHDVYELAADWNRTKMDPTMLRKPLRENYGKAEDADKWYRKAMDRYETSVDCMRDFRYGLRSPKEMAETYGREWKRCLGIDIACYDEQNAKLPFPIKVTRFDFVPYTKLPPSLSDENQGFGCEEGGEE